ncbi:uncharacterized protein A4U43_C07F10200 [Asparagus officinalis]|uniref:Uncharacterized protein n=1 Tax=Asparagus officinalis TaxID=4686 RepID=A0A5P1EAS6_ASPOF|nr:uncharacterized protein A4U43_C07F10200 [Asparagus officinalis]
MNSLMTKSFLSYQDLKKEALRDLEAGAPPTSRCRRPLPTTKNLRRFFEERASWRSRCPRSAAPLRPPRRQRAVTNPPQARAPQVLRSQINSLILRVLKSAKSIRDASSPSTAPTPQPPPLPATARDPRRPPPAPPSPTASEATQRLMLEFQDRPQK